MGFVASCFTQGRNWEIGSDEAIGVALGPLVKVFECSSGYVIRDEERVIGVERIKIRF